jgi:hypothetical protein
MDAVEPHHYTRWKIQPIEFIRANKLGFAEANIIKYVLRHDQKDGLQDLMKAKQYLEWMIEDSYGPKGQSEGTRKVHQEQRQVWDSLDNYSI